LTYRIFLKKIECFESLFVNVGFVGQPLPGVNVRIVKENIILLEGDDKNIQIADSVKHNSNEGYCGDLQIKGKNVFKEYWHKPESTKKEFTDDGWFKTGKFMLECILCILLIN